MTYFGICYIKGVLAATKWPRKKGFFRREVVNTMVLNSTIKGMIDWSTGIGAGKPKLALKIISTMGKNLKNIEDVFDKSYKYLQRIAAENPEKSPSDIFMPEDIKSLGPENLGIEHFNDSINANQLDDSAFCSRMEDIFSNCLIYGLANPKRFEEYYKENRNRLEKRRPEMIEAGIAGLEEKLPTLEDFYRMGEEIISGYIETTGKPLSEISESLRKKAEALDIFLK